MSKTFEQWSQELGWKVVLTAIEALNEDVNPSDADLAGIIRNAVADFTKSGVEILETEPHANGDCRPASCSQLPDAVTRALRHARLFIGERRGYRNNEEEERDDICKQIDEILSANSGDQHGK